MRGSFIRARLPVCFSAAQAYKPHSQVSESAVAELLENVCNPEESAGAWVASVDIVTQGEGVGLQRQGGIGFCKRECQTVAKSCNQLFEDLDLDELQVALWKGGTTAEKLQHSLCKVETSLPSNSLSLFTLLFSSSVVIAVQ